MFASLSIDQPVYSQTGATVCAMLALLFLWMHWRHRDVGALAFALGFASICVIYAFGLRTPPGSSQSHPAGVLFGALGVSALAWGMTDYLGGPPAQRWRWRIAAIGPLALAIVVLAATGLPRAVGHGAIAVTLTVMATMSWRASNREARGGHRLVAASLMLHPLLLVAMLLHGDNVYLLRYVLLWPISLFGAMLFAVSLTRIRSHLEQALSAQQAAQAELARLNASLEQQVAERTAELNAMIGGLESFNRSVSHDLRGPLAGISGLARLANERVRSADLTGVGALLETIAGESDRLATLVHDLLLLARVNDAPIEAQPVELGDCVQEALQRLDLAGLPTQVVELGPMGALVADRGLLRQLLVNLIGNAIKFSRGAPQPHVRVALEHAAGRSVLVVDDNGVGFEPARAAELFEPFKRLHREVEGTGIGLTIVRRIAERHGGSVRAEGRPGRGATFRVALPA